MTNAVKHFKWEQRGKRRIHQKPSRGEIEACHPWLEAEVEVIEPDVVLLLGATAAKAVLGASFSVTKHRDEVLESKFSPRTVATFHPSSVLRAGDDRHDAMDAFVADLRVVADLLEHAA